MKTTFAALSAGAAGLLAAGAPAANSVVLLLGMAVGVVLTLTVQSGLRPNDGTRPQPASSERVRRDLSDREPIMPVLTDRRQHCRCTGDRSINCPTHGAVGLRIGVDVHAAACFPDDFHGPDDWSCVCGLLACSWVGCTDEARTTIEWDGGLYRLCGEHWLLHDLGLLLTTGEVPA